MRKTIIVLLLAMAVIWMFQHPDDLRSYSGKVSRWAGDAFTRLADQWSPKPKKEAEPWRSPPPDPPQIDSIALPPPEGFYCLRQPVRFAFPGGSQVIAAGSEVRMIGQGNGKVVLTDGVGQVTVDVSVVTRDPVEIHALKHQHLVAERQMAAASLAQKQQMIREIDTKLGNLRHELKVVTEKENIARLQGRSPGLGTSPDFIRATIARLERQKMALQAEASPAPPQTVPQGNPLPQ